MRLDLFVAGLLVIAQRIVEQGAHTRPERLQARRDLLCVRGRIGPDSLELVQEPAEPDVVDGGIPASGLVAHTLISRFADHLPFIWTASASDILAKVTRAKAALAATVG